MRRLTSEGVNEKFPVFDENYLIDKVSRLFPRQSKLKELQVPSRTASFP